MLLGMTSLVCVSLLLVDVGSALAKCADPRGCWPDLCRYPGNVVEVTIIREPLTVRVDAVTVIDADRFFVPAIDTEVELLDEDRAHEVGGKLIVLAREPGNAAWPLFELSSDGKVRCLNDRIAPALTIAQVEDIVRLKRCDESPLPQPGPCDDQDDSCSSGTALQVPMVVAVLLVLRSLLAALRWSLR